jgi:hypothetical protein
MAGPATGNSGSPEPDPFSASLPSALDAVDDLRTAAKWTLAAVGAVGAVLISGGPLIAVGEVHGVANALLAGLGLAISMSGVGLAIWFTSKVLEPRLTTPATLTEPLLAGLMQTIDREPAQFVGVAATSVAGLFKRQDDNQAIALDLARQAAVETVATRRAALQAQLRRVENNGARISAYVRLLLALAHVWRIQEDLRRSRWFTLAGGILVIVGAVVFFSATGSGAPTYVPVVTVSPAPTVGPPATP